VHDGLVGCDRGSVSPSVGSAGFCAGAPSQSADWGGGGGGHHSWGGPVHQVVFHLLLLLSSRPLSLLLLLLLLLLSPGWRCLELLLGHLGLLLLRQLPLLPRWGGQVAPWVVQLKVAPVS